MSFPRPPSFWFVAIALAVQGAAAGLASSRPFFYVSVATSQRLFGGSIGEAAVFDDVDLYRRYASAMLAGERPYRDLAVEYPIGALPLFLAPRVLTADPWGYRLAFAAEMLAAQGILLAILAAIVGRREGPGAVPGRLGWSCLIMAALGPLPIARFDLVPALLAFGSAALFAGLARPGVGGLVAAIGTLVKVFPGAVMVPAMTRPGRWRGVVAYLPAMAAGLLGWRWLAGENWAGTFRYHAERGLEIESVGAGLLMLVAKAAGWPLDRLFDHTSERLIAPGAETLAQFSPPIQLALLLLVAWRARPARQADAFAAPGAAVLAFLIGGKVLSPQYLLWVAPFVLALDGPSGRRARPLLLLGCVLTTAVYPWSFIGLTRFHPLAVAILNARNLVLLALFVILLGGSSRSAPEPNR